MKRSAVAVASRLRVRLRLVVGSTPDNDNAQTSARDRMLADIDAWWLQEHRRVSTPSGRWMRLTVRYVGELVTEERLMAFTGRRVEVWLAEMSQPIESVQTFLLRVR